MGGRRKWTEFAQVDLDDPQAAELGHLASVWCDLILARQTLHLRSELPYETGSVMTRRALWEQAVIAYARCFNKGRRTKLKYDEVDALGAKFRRTHDLVLEWRNEHVAHRANQAHERARPVLILDRKHALRPASVRVHVATSLGPTEEWVATEFEELADALANRVWRSKLAPLAESIVARQLARPPRVEEPEPVRGEMVKDQLLFSFDPRAGTVDIVPPPDMWHPDYIDADDD